MVEKKLHCMQEMVRNFNENKVLVNTVGKGIFMDFFFLTQTYNLCLLCSCY